MLAAVLVCLHALDSIISSIGLGSGRGLVTTLTLTHPDIERIGTIEPRAMVFKLPLPTRFIIQVLFLSLSSVEC